MLSLKAFGDSPGFFPGFLSFCLPGLGQLYQRRFLAAALGFFPFWFCLARYPGHPWTLLLSVAFATEAFRRAGHAKQQEVKPEALTRRKLAYTITAVIGFCFWGMLVSPAALPLQRQSVANAAADQLSVFIRDCARRRGERPALLEECAVFGIPKIFDPWGGNFHYVPTDRGFELRSFGADGKAGNSDDFLYRYRFR